MEKIFILPWHVPSGAFSLKIDQLSLVFLIAATILVVCAAVYAIGSMRQYRGKRSLGLHVFFFLLLVLVLFIIMTANNIILFLGAWEGLTISTYFLIVFHDEIAAVRRAGFIYLIASHCATFCLFLMFFIMAHVGGSMELDVIARVSFPPVLAGAVFLLALTGFGVKAGFLPLHIWLPHAHPAAPSHISALLSGITIKMGIYGICRIMVIVGVLPVWCGYVLLMIGVVSGVMGVLYALGQHELKKLLAYHSIENIGIIALGLGLGLLGRSYDMPFLAILGFGGALLHVVNHALFKGLLFLSAGAIIQKTHTGEMDHLGGLAKIMPVTSVLFLIGALSICGLPLFNGFIGEFIIYFGLFYGLMGLHLPGVVFCSVGIVALALMGVLALACFCKVYGTVFSGHPRTKVEGAGETDPCGEQTSLWMLFPMFFLAGLCIWIGLFPGTAVQLAFLGGAQLAHVTFATIDLEPVLGPLAMLIGVAFLFIALILGLIIVHRLLGGASPMPVRAAWACGFTQVSSRFQYTSSSFAHMIVDFMKGILLVRRSGGHMTAIFPGKAHMTSSVHDASEERMFRPLLVHLTALSKKIDHGRARYTQMYLMYIFLFLIFLLVWKLK